VRLTLNRNGETKAAEVKLGAAEDEGDRGAAVSRPNGDDSRFENELSFKLRPLTPELASRMGLDADETRGLVITDIDPASAAYRAAGLREGAIIVEVDRKPVDSMASFERIYNAIPPGKSFLVRVRYSQGGTAVTALTKPAR
jgi:serine protease Do